MRIAIDHDLPFILAHGGFQVQIEQTRLALAGIGVEVDWLRWWDSGQAADIIHFFGRPARSYIDFAHRRGIRVVFSELLTGLGSRSRFSRSCQQLAMHLSRASLPLAFRARLAWDSFVAADAVIANTPWEARLMVEMFQTPQERLHTVPNGVEEIFLNAAPQPRGDWLVCAATITERKRVVELAQAAVAARVPLRIIGKPYAETDEYARRLIALCAAHPDILRHDGAISDRGRLAGVYRESRGFVLLSSMETRSLAAEEAAACECPLLLSDLPWARSVFGPHAEYCPIAGVDRTADFLRQFYERADKLPPPLKPASWATVAQQLQTIYTGLLSSSR